MIPSRGSVDTLKRNRPEWSPWLAVVEEVLRESVSAKWDAAVPAEGAAGEHGVPMLARTTVAIDEAAMRRFLMRLAEIASRGGTPKMATLRPALRGDVDVAALFAASLCQDSQRVADIAAASGANAEALQAVVGMVSVPFLHACNRQWRSAEVLGWTEGFCPICGSWPAFAEMRGIERTRHLRCGRCGGEWLAHLLECTYCRNHDHGELARLVAEQSGLSGSIDACRRCRGYVKVFTRLQGCPPTAVMLEDLGSVALDVAAIGQGYTRPSGAGYVMDISVTASAAPKRRFTWNA